jgi:hypothetical protein
MSWRNAEHTGHTLPTTYACFPNRKLGHPGLRASPSQLEAASHHPATTTTAAATAAQQSLAEKTRREETRSRRAALLGGDRAVLDGYRLLEGSGVSLPEEAVKCAMASQRPQLASGT